MRTLFAAACALALAAPLSAYAAGVAGFPSQPIWLSTDHAAAGSEVLLYTAIYNHGDSDLDDTVTFLVDGNAAGTSHVHLPPGQSQIAVVSWKATEGAHAFSARLGTTNETPGTVQLSVAAAPARSDAAMPPAMSAALASVASSSPALGAALSSLASTTESFRVAGARAIQAARVRADPEPSAPSAGFTSASGRGTNAATTSPSQAAAVGFASAALSTIYRAALAFLYAIFANAVYFYPVIAVTFLLLLYIAGRALRRPRF